MLTNPSVDLGTVAVLAIVVWLDGWRRVSGGTILVARTALGPWIVRAPWLRAGPFALVTWCASLVVPFLLAPPLASGARPAARWTNDFAVATARTARRLRRARPVIVFLRALGILLTLWIIVGIPVATARFGGHGLIYGVLGAFVLAIEITLITTLQLTSLGVSFGRSFRVSAQLLSPFTAPRAAEIIIAEAVGRLHSLAPIAALLGEQAFLTWLRPWAYDELAGRERGSETDATLALLVRALPRHVLDSAVRPAAAEITGADGARYCPRCARTYRDVAETCANCDQLALVTMDAAR
jgi:hypothetical protein